MPTRSYTRRHLVGGRPSSSSKSRRAPAKSASTSSKSHRAKSAPAAVPIYATRAQFEAWEATVKKHVPTFVKGKNAVREFDSLLMCIQGIPEGKRMMRVHHVGKRREERVFIRKWKPRQSASSTVDKTKFVAFDLRGPSFYITETSKLDKTGDAGAWCKADKGEFGVDDSGVHIKGKAVTSSVFVTKLLAHYHKLCPTVKDPSKDAETVEQFIQWADSLQAFAKECGPGTTLTIRFARRPFTRATETRTKNFRVVVPAKTVKAKCKQYYLRANRAKDATFAKECPDCDKAGHCLALDIHDDRTVVADAHVSPNLVCAKTDYLSRAV